MACNVSWSIQVLDDRAMTSLSELPVFAAAWGVRVRVPDCCPLMRRPHGPGRPYGDQRGSVGGSEASRD